MIDISLLKAMAAAGATADVIIAAVEVMEAKRSKALAAERQRRKRAMADDQPELELIDAVAENDAVIPSSHVESRTVTLDHAAAAPSPPSFPSFSPTPPIITLPSTPPEETMLRRDPREAPGTPLISQEAFETAEAIGLEAGFSPQSCPPGWCGAAWEVQRFLNDGYPSAMIRIACTAVLRRGRGPPENFGYFRKAIVDMRARLEAPLPVAVPRVLEVIDGGRSDARTGTSQRGRIVAGRAVGKHYGSACDALDALGEEFAREAERRGEGPYIPTHLRG